MSNFKVDQAQTLGIFAEFNASLFKEDNTKCVHFSFYDRDGQPINVKNNLSPITDEDLAAIHFTLIALLKNVVEPEINARFDYEKNVQKQIENLVGIINPLLKLKEKLMAKQRGVLPFTSKGAKTDSADGTIADHGEFGGLKYEVYSRNVIHIFDEKLMFHKDIGNFEEEIEKLDFAAMGVGETHLIKGSGDTDNLVFRCAEDGIKVELTRKGFDVVEKLKAVLRKNKK